MAGNFKVFKRVYLLKKMLKPFGIELERLRIEWISAIESQKLVRVAKEFVSQIRKLGPLMDGGVEEA